MKSILKLTERKSHTLLSKEMANDNENKIIEIETNLEKKSNKLVFSVCHSISSIINEINTRFVKNIYLQIYV
jgi:hypothetical protein